MTTRNSVALVLTIVAIAMLVPGLRQPVLTLSATMDLFGTKREIFSETRSILGAIKSLHGSGNDFVAGLILLFSVLVPILKGMMTIPMFLIRDLDRRYRLYRFVQSISKWSMADVFAVGIFIAMLAATATSNMHGSVQSGFYWFASYCLVSNLAFQMLRIDPPAPTPRPVSSSS